MGDEKSPDVQKPEQSSPESSSSNSWGCLDALVQFFPSLPFTRTITGGSGKPRTPLVPSLETVPIARITERLAGALEDEASFKRLLKYQENDAQVLLDLLQFILRTNRVEGHTWRTFITAMKRLSSKTALYPSGFYLSEVEQTDQVPIGAGNFADVYKGSHQGRPVCLKVIRTYQSTTAVKLAKNIAKEAMLWSQLSHPNLIPFHGLYRFPDSARFALVSAWADNGNVIEFLGKNPEANRTLLCLDMAKGLEYLHKNDVIHGDLKGVNVLVDASHRAYLADFGLSSVDDPNIIYWASQSAAASTGGTLRWRAPELLVDGDSKNTKASDIYAWACVCYEVFTGKVPFHEQKTDTAILKLVPSGAQPTQPEESIRQESGLTDAIWELMTSCWARKAKKRPNSPKVLAHLEALLPKDGHIPPSWGIGPQITNDSDGSPNNVPLTLEELNILLSGTSLDKLRSLRDRLLEAFENEPEFQSLFSYGGSKGQELLDTFQAILKMGMSDKTSWTKFLLATQKLSFQINKYPNSFDITKIRETSLAKESQPGQDVSVVDIKETIRARGDHSEIYEGKLGAERVCIKYIKDRKGDRISREALLWAQLSHPNIVPFYGIYKFRKDLSLVSPWAENGNILNFLSRTQVTDCALLCLDAARGLAYLHKNGIIHGDIKGVNVLIDDSYRAYLTDFTFSSLIHGPDTIDALSTQGPVDEELNVSSVKWQAPELFQPGDPNDFNAGKSQEVHRSRSTKATDIYAWSCLCYEVFTGRQPFDNADDKTVLSKISRREQPGDLATETLERGLTDDIKKLMKDCWKYEANDRPSIEEVISRLDALNFHDDRKLAGFMDRPFLKKGRKSDVPITLKKLNEMISSQPQNLPASQDQPKDAVVSNNP